MNQIPNPTRHGNWQVIDGELIDVDTGKPYIEREPQMQAEPAEAEPQQSTPAPAGRKSSKPKE